MMNININEELNKGIKNNINFIYNMIENEIYSFEVNDENVTSEGRKKIIRGLIDDLEYLCDII